ncbi:MAG: heme-binding protein [Alphaproteobacteria bacterium]|nr:heme-binding protein [Alphaproteobacteria bacterium]
MKKLSLVAGAMILSTLLSACTVFGVRDGTEETSYEVVERLADKLEIRQYGPRLAAQALVEPDADGDDRSSDAFRMLFDYISGANRGARKVAMTVPVEMVSDSQKIAMTAPVEKRAEADGKTLMRFFLPSEFTSETAPEPTDPRVSLITVPGQTVAVFSFAGLGFDSTVKSKKQALMTRLETTDWRPVGEPFAYFYDPPWTLPPLRRNEVVVPVARRQ